MIVGESFKQLKTIEVEALVDGRGMSSVMVMFLFLSSFNNEDAV